MPRARTLDHEAVPRRIRDYETDFVGWAEDTARAIEEGRWNEVDRVAVADEIASLSRSDKRSVRSAFKMLFLHMLKLRHQPERLTRSWELSIEHAKGEIEQLVEESPSLRPQLAGLMEKAWADARRDAAVETGLSIETFPVTSIGLKEIWPNDETIR